MIENQYYSASNPDEILIKTLEFDNKFSIDLRSLKPDDLGLEKFIFDTKINQEVSIQQEFLNAYQDQILITKDINKINFFGIKHVQHHHIHHKHTIHNHPCSHMRFGNTARPPTAHHVKIRVGTSPSMHLSVHSHGLAAGLVALLGGGDVA